MLWLEMSRDEVHGGGLWGFGQCLWSPTKKTNGASWAFWETLRRVDAGDFVVHLRGKGKRAAFVGFSTAATAGRETKDRPPEPGEWADATSFYHVALQDFVPLDPQRLLSEAFEDSDTELREYYQNNRSARNKERLFYVIQSGRLQCLNGAYLSELSTPLLRLLLNIPLNGSPHAHSVDREVKASENLRQLLTRVGQREFSDGVLLNYSYQCCFPNCDVAEREFLRGAHIARWADAPVMRGQTSNGVCLCLMHDQAFERGMFTLDLDYRVWINDGKAIKSPWAVTHLLPFHGKQIRPSKVPPSREALLQHWERVQCYPS